MGSKVKPSEMNKRTKEFSEASKKRKKNASTDRSRIGSALGKSGISINRGISLNERAEMLLGAFECAVRPEKKNYSLITSCDDTEVIENENILDSTSYDVNPTPISAKDKFTNVSDPFYNLDSDIPDRYSIMNGAFILKNMPDFVCFAAKLNTVTNQIMHGSLTADTTTATTVDTTAAATTTTAIATTATTTTY